MACHRVDPASEQKPVMEDRGNTAKSTEPTKKNNRIVFFLCYLNRWFCDANLVVSLYDLNFKYYGSKKKY